jgi:plastocyanin
MLFYAILCYNLFMVEVKKSKKRNYMKATLIIVVIVIITVLIWGFVAKRGKLFQSQASPSQTSTQTKTATGNSVSIENLTFEPSSLETTLGTKVTWTNNDSTAHTVTSDIGAFSSPLLQPGETFEFTFFETGTIPYHCNINPTIKATITVK